MLASVAPLLLVLYIPVAVALFRRYPPDVAAVAFLVVGQLFLPEIHPNGIMPDATKPLSLPLTVFSKTNVLSYGLIVAVLACDRRRLAAFQPGAGDLPAAVLLAAPVVSGLVNGMDPQDVFAEWRVAAYTYGVPYLAGRLYCSEPLGLRRAVVGLLAGGLLYVLPCVTELIITPQLHRLVYGFHQHEFEQTIRFGGYRPMVFMQHGIAVGLFMVAATVAGGWLWWSNHWPTLELPDKLRRHPRRTLGVLGVTTLLVKSSGAIGLGVVGAAALWASRRFNSRLLLAAMLLVVPAYVVARSGGYWRGEGLLDAVTQGVDADRTKSFEFRLKAEDMVLVHAWTSPVLGHGGGERGTVKDDKGEMVVTDGMWIILLANYGFVGLTAYFGMLLFPVVGFVRAHRPAEWDRDWLAPAAIAAVVLTLFAVDCLLNAMLNPLWFMLAGGLTGFNALVRRYAPRPR